MNCKAGDLAVIISGASVGLFVTCVERYDGPWIDIDYKPGWRLDRPVLKLNGRKDRCICDEWIRPIRDNPGQDESLQWAPVPGERVTA